MQWRRHVFMQEIPWETARNVSALRLPVLSLLPRNCHYLQPFYKLVAIKPRLYSNSITDPYSLNLSVRAHAPSGGSKPRSFRVDISRTRGPNHHRDESAYPTRRSRERRHSLNVSTQTAHAIRGLRECLKIQARPTISAREKDEQKPLHH